MKPLQGAGEQKRPSEKPELDTPAIHKQALGQRWLTAGIAIPIVLTFVWFGGWFAFAATLLVVVVVTVELHQMFLHVGYHPLIWVTLGLSVLFLVSAMFPLQRLFLLEVGLGGALLLSFPWLFLRKQLAGAMVDWALTLAIPLYIGWPMSFFLLLRGTAPSLFKGPGAGWLFLPPGAWWLLLVLLGVWGFDAAAFFAGRFLGRHKLSPRISPGKTWEGVLGGFVLSIAAGLLFTVKPLGVPWYLAILLGLLLGSAAVLGDLAESLLKRQTRVKDSGQMMPGHGGLLDRIDSLLFAVVVVYIFAQLIGK